MADVTVTGLTAARMKEIENASIVDAEVDNDGVLTFITNGGQRIVVGSIKGPRGSIGPGGVLTKVNGKSGSEITLVAADFSDVASKSDLSNAITPVGTIVMTARSSAPSGWVLCQGQPISRSENQDLYNAIGVAYGPGNGTTTFNVPNLKGRVPVGRDTTQAAFDTLGETGGASTVTLTTRQIPRHTHELTDTSIVTTNRAYEQNPLNASDMGWGSVAAGLNGGRHFQKNEIGGTLSPVGNGEAHTNLQPYQVVNYMIKI